jgi:hypothetical protein
VTILHSAERMYVHSKFGHMSLRSGFSSEKCATFSLNNIIGELVLKRMKFVWNWLRIGWKVLTFGGKVYSFRILQKGHTFSAIAIQKTEEYKISYRFLYSANIKMSYVHNSPAPPLYNVCFSVDPMDLKRFQVCHC